MYFLCFLFAIILPYAYARKRWITINQNTNINCINTNNNNVSNVPINTNNNNISNVPINNSNLNEILNSENISLETQIKI